MNNTCRHQVVDRVEWKTAHRRLSAKEQELTWARDALAADRRRMPWLQVDHGYTFDGPHGPARLPDLFEGRRQLLLYRAFFEPGVDGWPDHACVGCSLTADQIAHLAHLNARDTTLVFASRAPQPDIERVKARRGHALVHDYRQFRHRLRCGRVVRHDAFLRDGDTAYRTYSWLNRHDEYDPTGRASRTANTESVDHAHHD